jgi:transcriptional regulator with AAA-type ATPase domain
MRKLYETLPDISKAKDPILITGETGTGKELWSRYIYSLTISISRPCERERMMFRPWLTISSKNIIRN